MPYLKPPISPACVKPECRRNKLPPNDLDQWLSASYRQRDRGHFTSATKALSKRAQKRNQIRLLLVGEADVEALIIELDHIGQCGG